MTTYYRIYSESGTILITDKLNDVFDYYINMAKNDEDLEEYGSISNCVESIMDDFCLETYGKKDKEFNYKSFIELLKEKIESSDEESKKKSVRSKTKSIVKQIC
jgi:hypothetical protein